MSIGRGMKIESGYGYERKSQRIRSMSVLLAIADLRAEMSDFDSLMTAYAWEGGIAAAAVDVC